MALSRVWKHSSRTVPGKEPHCRPEGNRRGIQGESNLMRRFQPFRASGTGAHVQQQQMLGWWVLVGELERPQAGHGRRQLVLRGWEGLNRAAG